MIRGAVVALAVVLLCGCTADLTGPQIISTAPVTSTPVPAVMLNPAVTQATIGETICVRGWTKTIRPRLPTKRGKQNDHIVSLELGGNPTNKANLRFVPLTRARQDDVLETKLNRQVCALIVCQRAQPQRDCSRIHPVPLIVAQQQIITAKQGE